MSANKPATKDGRTLRRERTEQRLVAAVGEVIEEHGFAALGVNTVAASAGVDKVLIYRYFGGLDELMRVYGETAEFWPDLDELLGPGASVLEETDPIRMATLIFTNYGEALRRRPLTLELLAWECVESNPLTVVLEEVRERRSAELFKALADAGTNLGARGGVTAGVFAASLNYLAIRGRDLQSFGGVDLSNDDAWRFLYQTLGEVLAGLVE